MDTKSVLVGLNLNNGEFLWKFYNLDVFPLFIAYLMMAMILPRIWKRFTQPLELKLVGVVVVVVCNDDDVIYLLLL